MYGIEGGACDRFRSLGKRRPAANWSETRSQHDQQARQLMSQELCHGRAGSDFSHEQQATVYPARILAQTAMETYTEYRIGWLWVTAPQTVESTLHCLRTAVLVVRPKCDAWTAARRTRCQERRQTLIAVHGTILRRKNEITAHRP